MVYGIAPPTPPRRLSPNNIIASSLLKKWMPSTSNSHEAHHSQQHPYKPNNSSSSSNMNSPSNNNHPSRRKHHHASTTTDNNWKTPRQVHFHAQEPQVIHTTLSLQEYTILELKQSYFCVEEWQHMKAGVLLVLQAMERGDVDDRTTCLRGLDRLYGARQKAIKKMRAELVDTILNLQDDHWEQEKPDDLTWEALGQISRKFSKDSIQEAFRKGKDDMESAKHAYTKPFIGTCFRPNPRSRQRSPAGSILMATSYTCPESNLLLKIPKRSRSNSRTRKTTRRPRRRGPQTTSPRDLNASATSMNHNSSHSSDESPNSSSSSGGNGGKKKKKKALGSNTSHSHNKPPSLRDLVKSAKQQVTAPITARMDLHHAHHSSSGSTKRRAVSNSPIRTRRGTVAEGLSKARGFFPSPSSARHLQQQQQRRSSEPFDPEDLPPLPALLALPAPPPTTTPTTTPSPTTTTIMAVKRPPLAPPRPSNSNSSSGTSNNGNPATTSTTTNNATNGKIVTKGDFLLPPPSPQGGGRPASPSKHLLLLQQQQTGDSFRRRARHRSPSPSGHLLDASRATQPTNHSSNGSRRHLQQKQQQQRRTPTNATTAATTSKRERSASPAPTTPRGMAQRPTNRAMTAKNVHARRAASAPRAGRTSTPTAVAAPTPPTELFFTSFPPLAMELPQKPKGSTSGGGRGYRGARI